MSNKKYWKLLKEFSYLRKRRKLKYFVFNSDRKILNSYKEWCMAKENQAHAECPDSIHSRPVYQIEEEDLKIKMF